MALRDQDEIPWLVDLCTAPPNPAKGIARRCRARQGWAGFFWVEVISGTKNQETIRAVREYLASWPQPFVCSASLGRECTAVLIEGPVAKTPRVESEVFYVGNAETTKAQAKDIARHLSPIIGQISPRAWPGKWSFDVVVVVGDKRPDFGTTHEPTSAPSDAGNLGRTPDVLP